MSAQVSATLERLEGFEILQTPEGYDAYTLILRVQSGEFVCVADHQRLQQLAAAIQKHAVRPAQLEG